MQFWGNYLATVEVHLLLHICGAVSSCRATSSCEAAFWSDFIFGGSITFWRSSFLCWRLILLGSFSCEAASWCEPAYSDEETFSLVRLMSWGSIILWIKSIFLHVASVWGILIFFTRLGRKHSSIMLGTLFMWQSHLLGSVLVWGNSFMWCSPISEANSSCEVASSDATA